MEREQWAVRVPRSRGELVRQELIREGVLDRELRPRVVGEPLLLPVTQEGGERAVFETRDAIPDLPRHELVGGIAIMLEPDARAAATLLSLRPSLHTVLFPQSEVQGEYRTRRFAVLAGKPTTATRVPEHGKRYEIDLAEAYFSARLATERQRIVGQVAAGEQVLDMFAGVGPFAITLAGPAGLVLAADTNPGAVRLMIRNIRLNRVRNVIPLLADAHRIPSVIHRAFDRIVMNHPTGATAFLADAFALCRPGGIIHLYVLQAAEGEALPQIHEFPVDSVTERYVRSYSPGRWHAVYDIRKSGP